MVTGEHIVTPSTDVPGLDNVTIQLVLAGVQMWHERIMGGDSGPTEGEPPTDGAPA